MKLATWLAFVPALLVGCMREGTHEDPGGTPDIDNGFESDDPQARRVESAADGGAAAPVVEENDASRAVQEADIMKVAGDRLYALSKYGGLAVIDLSNPDRLRLLGRKRLDAVPFEMYVEGSHAFVMLNDYGRWVPEGSYGRWVDTSEILALDVTDPASIAETAHFDVPGRIADSRMVGDVAYVVTYENGGCWGCQEKLATVVTSFHVGDAITRRDQLLFASPTSNAWSWQRSVAASDKRLYIAGPDYTWSPGQSNPHSTVQVVDIADPTGKLTKGADVHVEGGIESRWQIDEHEGVLRVVSQFGGRWGGGSTNPRVQTFTIASSASITPLGQTDLVLPMPETLRSVRFDGARAYAITAQQTDPLFTIDLSNPAAPKQVGTLEMPGWIFHLEPRGDRVVGFGYDGTDLAVSLFDVTNPAAPSMLKRVRFGSGWSSLPEDQNRIHKAVQVLDAAGLVLVPFASYGHRSQDACGEPQSGIQIIDYSRDDLVLRGVAPQWGMPRRSLLAKNRLLAMSDRNVTAFDLASKDAPTKTNELDLSNPAYRLAELPEHVASITNDWWTGEAMLSITPKANVDDAQAMARLSLKSLSPATCAGGWASWYEAKLLASGSMLYVAVPVVGNAGAELVTAAVDVSDPAHPRIAGRASSPFVHRPHVFYMFWEGWGFFSYFGGYRSSLLTTGEGLVRVGTKLAYLEVANEWSSAWLGEARASKLHRVLHVVDFADPAAPVVHPPIALKESLGASPLHVYEGKVLTTRWINSNRTPGKVRFFADRVDLNRPVPTELASVNTPGSLLLADEPSHRIVTADYRILPGAGDSTWQSCVYDVTTGACRPVERDLKLSDLDGDRVTLRQTFTPPSQNLGAVTLAEDRLYVTRWARYDYADVSARLLEDGGLWAIGGVRAGQLSIVSQFTGDARWPLATRGSTIALYTAGGLEIWDTATAEPRRLTTANLRGYGYASHVLLGEHGAVASLGERGLQSLAY